MKLFLPLALLLLVFGCNPTPESEEPIELAEPDNSVQFPAIDYLWDYNNPAESEKKFRNLLPEAKKSSSLDYQIQLMTQIARALGLQLKYDEAHKVLDEAEPMLTDETKTAKIRYLLERGRVYNSSGKTDEAKKFFTEAYTFGKDNKLDYYTFDAMHMLGIAGTPEEQINWNLKAIELIENTKNEGLKQWLGPVYNNIGWAYHEMDKFEKASEYFEKSLKWWEANNHSMGIFFAKWTVARGYRSLGKIDEAIAIQLALAEQMKTDENLKYGYVYDELGELYLLKDNEEEAYKNFKLAHDMLLDDEWLHKNKPEHWQRIKEFAEKSK